MDSPIFDTFDKVLPAAIWLLWGLEFQYYQFSAYGAGSKINIMLALDIVSSNSRIKMCYRRIQLQMPG